MGIQLNDKLNANQQDTIKALIKKGKKAGSLTIKEIQDKLYEFELNKDQIDEIYDALSEMDIEVITSGGDHDDEDLDDDDIDDIDPEDLEDLDEEEDLEDLDDIDDDIDKVDDDDSPEEEEEVEIKVDLSLPKGI